MSVNVLDIGQVCTCGVCMCAYQAYLWCVCSVHVQAHECGVYMCVCVQAHVCVHTCKAQVDPGSLPCSLFTLYMETGSLAARMTSQLTPGIPSPYPMCWAHRQANHPHTHQNTGPHTPANTLSSKHLPRAMFCFVWSSVYAVLYHLTHDFSHETNNLTHHAFFPYKVFRRFP